MATKILWVPFHKACTTKIFFETFSKCTIRTAKTYPIDLRAVPSAQPVQNDDDDKTATSA